MKLIFVDTEDANPTSSGWTLREFGAVEFESRRTFHGKDSSRQTFEAFKKWLESFGRERKVFVSDNPAYDWAPIHFYFHLYFGENPFGHSARRIGDFYAGLVGDFGRASEWKRLRITKHDHHPVNDAMGNVEAFARMLAGERVRPAKERPCSHCPSPDLHEGDGPALIQAEGIIHRLRRARAASPSGADCGTREAGRFPACLPGAGRRRSPRR